MDRDFIVKQMQRSDLTSQEAIAIAQSGDYKQLGLAKFAFLQLQQKLMCGDFSYFHQAVELLLARPVFTHEFINAKGLVQEALGNKQSPTFREIVDLIPDGKAIVIEVIAND